MFYVPVIIVTGNPHLHFVSYTSKLGNNEHCALYAYEEYILVYVHCTL